jgi:HNH endonuclease
MMEKAPKNMPIKDRFERFFIKGRPDECWIWLGSKIGEYGQFIPGCEFTLAHRTSYLLYKGEIPAGMQILHSCDNKPCVNPDHLSTGSACKNTHESWARDRKKNSRKLSPEDILEIRKSGDRQCILAVRFGVTPSHIKRIKNHERGHGIMMMIDGIPPDNRRMPRP